MSPRTLTRLGPVALIALGLGLLLPTATAVAAEAPIGLGTASSFAVLAGAGITNTGPTTIAGDIGSHPTPAVTGADTITLEGANHGDDAVTAQAKTDLTTAYNEAAGRGPATDVETELGGLTLTPGVYGNETLGITGALTLNTLGDPNAVFIFQADSTLITASNSSVIVLGGGNACNVFWQVGSSATLGTSSHLIGTVMASASIEALTNATIQGRLLAQTASVTLQANTITRPSCAATPGSDGGTDTDGTAGTDASGTGGTDASGTAGDAGGADTTGGSDGSGVPALSAGSGSDGSGGTVTQSTPGEGGATTDAGITNQRIGRPALPNTGSNASLALLGVAVLGVGVYLMGAANLRRPVTNR